VAAATAVALRFAPGWNSARQQQHCQQAFQYLHPVFHRFTLTQNATSLEKAYYFFGRDLYRANVRVGGKEHLRWAHIRIGIL